MKKVKEILAGFWGKSIPGTFTDAGDTQGK